MAPEENLLSLGPDYSLRINLAGSFVMSVRYVTKTMFTRISRCGVATCAVSRLECPKIVAPRRASPSPRPTMLCGPVEDSNFREAEGMGPVVSSGRETKAGGKP
jgi:hypothetical protein